MPTLSQWKILNSLMLQKKGAQEHVTQDTQEEDGDPEEERTDGIDDHQHSPRLSSTFPNPKGTDDDRTNDTPSYSADGHGNTNSVVDMGRIHSSRHAFSPRPTSSRNKISDKPLMSSGIFGETISGTQEVDVNATHTNPRLRSAARRRSVVDVHRLPEVAENESFNRGDAIQSSLSQSSYMHQREGGGLSCSSSHIEASTYNLHSVDNASGVQRTNETPRPLSTPGRSSSVQIPDLLDPNKLHRRKSSSYFRQRSAPSRQEEMKPNKSVQFSCHDDVAHLALKAKNANYDSDDDEDKLPISFDDVERRFSDNLAIKARPRSSPLSDRDATKRPMQSLMIVNSLQPAGNHDGGPSAQTIETNRNFGQFKRAVQLLRRNTSPYLSLRNRALGSAGGRNQGQQEDNNNTNNKRSTSASRSESSAKQNWELLKRQAGMPKARLGSAGSLSPLLGNRALKRNPSRLSLPGCDANSDLNEAGPENNLIIRGGPQVNPSSDDPSDAKNPFARTSSIRSGIHEVSRWSMATQSIVTEQCASPASGSRPSSGILVPQQPVVVSDTDMPQEVQSKLQKLGFRKRDRSKKKKDKSSKKSGQKKSAKVELPKNAIDLKRDPMLLKVQKKNRNVGKFTCPPDPMPYAVCFEVPGTALTHNDVIQVINPKLQRFPEVKVRSIQFVYRSLINSTPEMDNRWIINTNSVMSRNRLAGSEITINGQVLQLRRYDDIINGEYQQYTRMMNFVQMMNSRKIL